MSYCRNLFAFLSLQTRLLPFSIRIRSVSWQTGTLRAILESLSGALSTNEPKIIRSEQESMWQMTPSFIFKDIQKKNESKHCACYVLIVIV